MTTSLKKIVAGATAVALVSMNAAYAATTLSGAVTGGQTGSTPINSTWDGVSTPSGTTASGSDTVHVSAQVVPTLSLVISTGALNFGALNVGNNTQSLTLTTATNAEGGITLTAGSLGLASPTKYIGALAHSGTVATTGNDAYRIDSTTSGSGTALAQQDVAGTQTVLTALDVAKSNQTTTVNLHANIDNQTEAGNYGDTLTFTVTGNF